ncbi:FGGY-family carbohydrate kinase [Limnochorda pilosa]|uniref:Actin n=1 Tax=Limnochorda pilosa TaxID=1555112 RepID=A0A0K2SLJ6_LIMPI|nr:FGGY-family carbohydrate kinase [Limnochorda pilosa]BAS27882.1 actin [Limnochorda pilosa]
MEHLIGLDIGTQGTKAVVVRRDGRVLGSSYVGYDVDQPRPLWAEQWPDVWLDASYQAIRDVLDRSGAAPSEVAGLAISSLYGGSGIPVDRDLQPLAPCLIWMDRRASAEVRWVQEHVDLERLYRITSNTVDSYYGFTKILWIKNNLPDVWEKTHLFLPPNAYVIHRLTGEVAIDHTSAGNLGGLYDVHRRAWSEEMAEALGIPLGLMPQRIVASQDVVGRVTAEAARATGLTEGTPVVAGGVDAPVATLSAGAFREGHHVAMVGTSMCWGFITDRTNLTPALVSYPHVVDPMHTLYTFGGAATAGAVVRWFRDVLGRPEKEAAERLGVDAYSLLELESMQVPAGSDGLLVLPYFMGERSPIWDGNARGTVLGLSLYHSKAHLYKAFMEGVAFALRHNMESAPGVDLDREMILVGGAAKSMVWPQIFADVTGFPVRTVEQDVEAPLGDALLAGLGTGVVDHPEALLGWLTYREPVRPREELKPLYDHLFEEYKALYTSLKGNMARLYGA